MWVDSKDASCGHGDMTTVCKFLFFFLNNFTYLFLAVLGLLCFMQASRGHSLVVVLRLLIAEHGLWGDQAQR